MPEHTFYRDRGKRIFDLICAGAAVIVLGYFAFEGALYGFPAAFVAIFPNVVQVLFGVLVATALRAQGAVKMFER